VEQNLSTNYVVQNGLFGSTLSEALAPPFPKVDKGRFCTTFPKSGLV